MHHEPRSVTAVASRKMKELTLQRNGRRGAVRSRHGIYWSHHYYAQVRRAGALLHATEATPELTRWHLSSLAFSPRSCRASSSL